MDFENSRLKEEEMSATSIPLLRFNDEIEQWSVHSEGASYLRDLRGKSLVITSIAGRYRSGKSFLLNKLIGKDVFGVSSSCNGCTQGIDMWCESSGDAVLVFLDTAGLFDTENHGSPDHDIKLMMLTIMISSVFIYAVNSVIDENLIKQLDFTTKMIDHIQDSNQLIAVAPYLMCVVKDFTLDLEDNGRVITEREYLEKSLRLKPGMSPKIKKSNQTREDITKFFSRRDCMVFKQPAEDSKQLNCKSVLRKEFEDKVKQLKEKINSLSTPFTLNGVSVDGLGFVSFLETVVQQVNNNQKIQLADMNTLVLSQLSELAYKESINMFLRRMGEIRDQLPLEEQDLLQAVAKAFIKVEQNYKSQKYNTPEQLSKLKYDMQQQANQLKEENYRISEETCRKLVKKVKKPLKNLTEITSENQYDCLLCEAVLAFQNQAIGPAKSTFQKQLLDFGETQRNAFRLLVEIPQEKQQQLSKMVEELTIKDKETSKLLSGTVKELDDVMKKKLQLEKKLVNLEYSQKHQTASIERLLQEKEQMMVQKDNLTAWVEYLKSQKQEIEEQQQSLKNKVQITEMEKNKVELQKKSLEERIRAMELENQRLSSLLQQSRSSYSCYSPPSYSSRSYYCGVITTRGTPCKNPRDSCPWH